MNNAPAYAGITWAIAREARGFVKRLCSVAARLADHGTTGSVTCEAFEAVQ
jgi:hypothetical protein